MRQRLTDSPYSALLLAYVLLGLTASCGHHGFSIDPVPEPQRLIVDLWPTWSPDGSHIAYFRALPSSDGPPGLYTIRTDGTENRLLMDGGGMAFWLLYLRYTPDGSHLLATIGGRFTLIDVNTGKVQPLPAGGYEPDMSPDCRSIIYRGASEELRILDLTTGMNEPLGAGERVVGADAQWSPDGKLIAFWTGFYNQGLNIYTIKPDGSELTRRTSVQEGYADDPRWLNGGTQLMYSFNGNGGLRQTHVILPNQRTIVWPRRIGTFDAISHDSRFIVTTAAQDDSIDVLFTCEIDDPDGRTLRQVTSYRPASTTSPDDPAPR